MTGVGITLLGAVQAENDRALASKRSPLPPSELINARTSGLNNPVSLSSAFCYKI